ncbi:MAG: hypothetical protein Q8S31_04545 [Alphaproteobacteria bacterium]|nr:hypothetical protein [Alphaproteobacteria bacterium]
MKKTTFLIGTIWVALNVQPLHAGETPEERKKICQEKWGTKEENVRGFLDAEQDWINKRKEKNSVHNEAERIERSHDLHKLIYKLREAHCYCDQNGHEYASAAYADVVEEYNEFFGSNED